MTTLSGTLEKLGTLKECRERIDDVVNSCQKMGLPIIRSQFRIVDSVTGLVVDDPQPNASAQSKIEAEGKVYE